jgi:hypothetical protein
MQTGLLTRVAVGALLAAASLSGAGVARAAAQLSADDAVIIDAERGINSENGIHAVPSGHVAAAPLAARPQVRKPAPPARPAPVAVSAPSPKPVQVAIAPPRPAPAVAAAPVKPAVKLALATAPSPPPPEPRHQEPAKVVRVAAQHHPHREPVKLTRTAWTPPPTHASAHASPAPAPSAPSRAASRRRAAVDPLDALIGPMDEADYAPYARIGDTPALVIAQAQIEAPAGLAAVADPATPTTTIDDEAEAATQIAEADADAPPDGVGEEASVYRRAARPAPAAAAPVEGRPSLMLAHEERRPADRHVAFPRRSAEAAAAFDGYMHAVARIDSAFTSGAGVAAALRTASAYDPRQLEEGMVAYGAMAALQSPSFVYAVMDEAADPDARQEWIQDLLADPESAARLPGAREAAALAGAAILREARPVLSAGQALKQASYDVQRQDWSVARATDQTGRLARAKAASSGRLGASEADMARMLDQVARSGGGGEDGGGGLSPVTERSVALAALTILDGAVGDDARLEPVVSEASSAACLRLAKLNLFQCLSVAGPEYEDVYCLAEHAVTDTGKCVAGAASPLDTLADNRPNRRMSHIPGYR